MSKGSEQSFTDKVRFWVGAEPGNVIERWKYTHHADMDRLAQYHARRGNTMRSFWYGARREFNKLSPESWPALILDAASLGRGGGVIRGLEGSARWLKGSRQLTPFHRVYERLEQVERAAEKTGKLYTKYWANPAGKYLTGSSTYPRVLNTLSPRRSVKLGTLTYRVNKTQKRLNANSHIQRQAIRSPTSIAIRQPYRSPATIKKRTESHSPVHTSSSHRDENPTLKHEAAKRAEQKKVLERRKQMEHKRPGQAHTGSLRSSGRLVNPALNKQHTANRSHTVYRSHAGGRR